MNVVAMLRSRPRPQPEGSRSLQAVRGSKGRPAKAGAAGWRRPDGAFRCHRVCRPSTRQRVDAVTSLDIRANEINHLHASDR